MFLSGGCFCWMLWDSGCCGWYEDVYSRVGVRELDFDYFCRSIGWWSSLCVYVVFLIRGVFYDFFNISIFWLKNFYVSYWSEYVIKVNFN